MHVKKNKRNTSNVTKDSQIMKTIKNLTLAFLSDRMRLLHQKGTRVCNMNEEEVNFLMEKEQHLNLNCLRMKHPNDNTDV